MRLDGIRPSLPSMIRLGAATRKRSRPKALSDMNRKPSVLAGEIDQLAGHTGVGGRGQCLEAGRGVFVEGLLIDEALDVLLGDLMASHEFLDLLVWLVHTWKPRQLAGAHGCLDRLAKHFPVGIELSLDRDVVRMDGIQTAHQVVQGQYGIAQRGTDVALRG